MATAVTTRGTWRLDEAVDRHWRVNGLDQAFRREWLDPTTTKYQPLMDGYAEPVPPGPYCVFEKLQPYVVQRMTGLTVGEERQIVSWSFRFHVHAQNTDGPVSESGKEIAVRLARKIAEVFDPHNVNIEIDGATHVLTERGPDWHVREADGQAEWVMEYRWLVDATMKVSSTEVIEESSTSSHSCSSYTESSQSSSSTSSSSSSTSCQTIEVGEDDDVLDFGDIGGVYDSAAAAVANTAALRAYLASRVNDSVALRFGGPKDYNDIKRQPGIAYLDLSSGAIDLNVGGTGNLTHLMFEGCSKIAGTGAVSATTPIFEITRGTGTMPTIVLRNMVFTSTSSVLKVNYGGSGLSIENIDIEDFTGSGTIDHEAWTEIDAETFSYGIWINDADGGRLWNVQIKQGSGHGIVATRWHQGQLQARIQHCDGAGFKLEQANGLEANIWAEHCEGYGLMCRDTGMNRRSGGVRVAQDGGPSEWLCWLEGNNGRSTSYSALGYRFSQFRFDNCARIRMKGHTGWSSNCCRIDRVSRLRCEFVEDAWIDPSVSPSIYLAGEADMVDEYQINENVVLPGDALNNASITNWKTVWPDEDDRPTAEIVGTGTIDDPERIRITIPAGCFEVAAGSNPAYWRPLNNASLDSPGDYYMVAKIKPVSGAAEWCLTREGGTDGDGVTNRQLATLGNVQIAPVSGTTSPSSPGDGAIVPFQFWDTNSRNFGTSYALDDTRSDIQPQLTVWVPGMQDEEGDASQDSEIVYDIYQMKLYKFTN